MKKCLKVTMLCMFAFVAMFWNPMKEVNAAEEVIVIYTQAPDEWKEPCLWAWSEDGKNAFEEWPGGTMTEDKENSGWYYTYVPNWVTSVIVNANEGSVQTEELQTNSQNTWVKVVSVEAVSVSNEQETKGKLPEYVSMMTINTKIPDDWSTPCIWAWSAPDGTNAFVNWPGEELKEGAQGWFSYQVPTWVNSIIINGNEGSVQTSDISVEAKDMWITVESAEETSISYEKPQAEVSKEDMITVYAKVSAEWLLPCIWAWSAPDGTNAFVNWPGEELVEGDDGWYSYEIPNWVNSIIINGNLGEIQTKDVSIEPKDVWIVVNDAETTEVFYEKPADVQPTEVVAESAIVEEVPLNDTNQNAIVIFVIILVLAVIAGGIVFMAKKKK